MLTWDPAGTELLSLPWEITKRGRFRLGSDSARITQITHDGYYPETLLSSRSKGGRYIKRFEQGKLQVWSREDDTKPLFELQHPDQTEIYQIALSNDGTSLAAFSTGKNLVWDLTETPPRDYLIGQTGQPRDPFFTEDGKLVIVADWSGIQVYDWVANRLARHIKFPGPVLGMTLHPDGQHVATVNGNGTVYILRIPELADHKQPIK